MIFGGAAARTHEPDPPACCGVPDPISEHREALERIDHHRQSGPWEGYGHKPRSDAPRYIHGCYAEQNYLLLWPKGQTPPPGGLTCLRVPARCNSWRHGGPCARRRARQDFARIREACDRYARRDLVFLVLTLDRNGTLDGRPYANRAEAFRALSRNWTLLRKRLDYQLAKAGHDPIGSRWVMVVEQHRNGWPHCNVMVVSRGLSKICRRQYAKAHAIGKTHRQSYMVADGCGLSLRSHVVAAGFGAVSSAEAVKTRAALAGYFVGLSPRALDIDPSAGELAKLMQVPTAAPPGFRRLRSGVGFLPKRLKRDTHTGVMINSWRNTIVTRGKTMTRDDADAGRETGPLAGLTLDVREGKVFRRDDGFWLRQRETGPP